MPPPWSVKRILRHNRAQIIEAGRAARLRLAPPVSPSGSGAATTRLEVIQASILFRHGDRSPSHNHQGCYAAHTKGEFRMSCRTCAAPTPCPSSTTSMPRRSQVQPETHLQE